MTEQQWVELLNAVILLAFVAGVVIAAVKTLQTVAWYKRHRLRRPRFLTRDAITFGGLGLTFLLIGLSRVFGWAPYVTGRWWWIVLSATPALIGVWTYVWYEFRVVSPARRLDDAARQS